MLETKRFQFYIIVVVITLFVSVIFSSLFTFFSLRTFNNEQQRKAVEYAEAYQKILTELREPVLLSKMIASNAFIDNWHKQAEDQDAMKQFLKATYEKWGVDAFLATDIFKHYYFRDEDVRVLTPQLEDSSWFFQLLEEDIEEYIDIGYHKGNLAEPYFYVDIKLNEIAGRKAGYVGMALPLQTVFNKMVAFKKKFGVALHFVNKDNMVVLSPDSTNVNKPVDEIGLISSKAKLSKREMTNLSWTLYIENENAVASIKVKRIFIRFLFFFVLILIILLSLFSYLIKRFSRDLQHAFNEINMLRGIIPICSVCKKVRNDDGYWGRLDWYIQQHSSADISHGMCPDCMKKMYGDLDIDLDDAGDSE